MAYLGFVSLDWRASYLGQGTHQWNLSLEAVQRVFKVRSVELDNLLVIVANGLSAEQLSRLVRLYRIRDRQSIDLAPHHPNLPCRETKCALLVSNYRAVFRRSAIST